MDEMTAPVPASVFVTIEFQLIWKIEPLGRRNELRASKAFSGTFDDVPLWFRGIENAPPHKDRAGVDIYVHTDIGRFSVQIKSSEKHASEFRQAQKDGHYSRKILVVVIHEDYDPSHIRRIILDAVEPAYRNKVAEVAAKHGVTFIAA